MHPKLSRCKRMLEMLAPCKTTPRIQYASPLVKGDDDEGTKGDEGEGLK